MDLLEAGMAGPNPTTIAQLNANGQVVPVAWMDGRWLAAGSDVPLSRLVGWEQSGSLEWVSDETRTWFHSLGEVAAEEQHPSTLRALEDGARARRLRLALGLALLAVTLASFALLPDWSARVAFLVAAFAASLPGFTVRSLKARGSVAVASCITSLAVLAIFVWSGDPKSAMGAGMLVPPVFGAVAALFLGGCGELAAGMTSRLRGSPSPVWVWAVGAMAGAFVLWAVIVARVLWH
jgi:hypothetical protein